MIKDIIIDDTGDLIFENGDFKVGQSDAQHVTLIVNTSAGAWKRFPTVGVGIRNYQSASGRSGELRVSIIQQLKNDGFTDIKVDLDSNQSTGEYDYYVNANLNE